MPPVAADATRRIPELPQPQPQPLPANDPSPVVRGNGTFSDQVAGTRPQQSTDLQFAEMSNLSYDGPGDVKATDSAEALVQAGWTRLQPSADGKALIGADGQRIAINPARLEDGSSGFRASIFQNAQGQYVVAYAGTDIGQPGDLSADATQAFGLETKQYNQAIALAKDVEVAFGDGNVVFTGHSLGGGLASAAALATDASAVTFNAAGLSNATMRQLGLNPNAARSALDDSGQVRRYVVESDPLTLAQQDLPAIPIPIGGVPVPISPPNAVGHELRIALPAGVTPVIGAHGGSGNNTSYVDALKQNTPYEPQDPGFVSNTVQNAGELVFNQFGSVVNEVKGNVTDLIDTGKNVASDIKTTIQDDYGDGNYVSGTVNIVGDIADNGLDLLGKTAANGVSLVGDTVQNVTDAGGQLIRDAADGTFLEKPADFVAGLVEGGGNLLAKGSDLLGDGVSWLADKGGDLLEWGLDKGGDALQWGTDKVVEGATWLGNKAVDGAKAVGNAFVDGAKAVNSVMPWNW